MPKTITYNKPDHLNELEKLTNSAVELVNWPMSSAYSLSNKVLALQTTRLSPSLLLKSGLIEQRSMTSLSKDKKIATEESPYGAFNLGLHVGDNIEKVTLHRNILQHFIRQEIYSKTTNPRIAKEWSSESDLSEDVEIQWLEQVHGNEVVEVTVVAKEAMTADASITRQKNIALAIMTADCLPILLTNKCGNEIAAIHGGWRSLAANIIAKTLDKMHSKPSDIVAWLGPCISKHAFEVGSEVKEIFTQQGKPFSNAFLKQANGKYLADLHYIARLQLQTLGVTEISGLGECTYHETNKYYSYRKEQVTGRMASLISLR
ncbi:peptidoglycan editing factor PgeF [Colwellia piezophila]|uniref:peptidoglycan editing factor PgeF n=1 Tax=Colwellia piezophila TaxID=211668 RepID=UPI0003695939|nr:peptidoglycan editing factor PgeF [Colwellia piezophila]